MNIKLTKNNLANSFALTTAVLWVVCSAFVAIFPGFSYTVTVWWMHGVNMDSLGKFHLSLDNFLWGGVSLVLSLWVAGYILGWSMRIIDSKDK